MRIVMLLLVLTNLGFLGWSTWIAPPGSELPRGRGAEESLGAGLLLVGEDASSRDDVAGELAAETAQDEESESTVVSEPVAEPDDGSIDGAVAEVRDASEHDESEVAPSGEEAVVGYRCVSLGPFDQLDAAEVALARLADRGYQARLRETGGQIRSGFWVYIPPLGSRNAAKEIDSQLREKGVTDLFIVTGSENRNAISLGLFSTAERADQRAAEIGRMGFSPQIAERFRDATVYWLDYRERDDDRLEPQSIGVSGADDVIPEKRQRDCGPDDFANE